MSRDNALLAFDSYADLANEHSGVNQLHSRFTFMTHRPIASVDSEREVTPIPQTGGSVNHYPGFTTDVDSFGISQPALVLERA